MEVHAQVTSNSKLFSGASTEFGGEPNSHVSLVDAAMPGMLPVINEECVRQAVRTGLGLNAKINHPLGVRPEELFLSRPAAGLSDQPVQIADRGRGRGRGGDTGRRDRHIGIERLHLEQDAANRCTTSIFLFLGSTWCVPAGRWSIACGLCPWGEPLGTRKAVAIALCPSKGSRCKLLDMSLAPASP